MNFWFERIRAIGWGAFERPSVLKPDQDPVVESTQKLYFDRMERRGSHDPVVTAKGWLDEGNLLGLEFIYMSGVTVRVGEIHTTFGSIQTVQFPRDCTCVGMIIAIKNRYMRALKVLPSGNCPDPHVLILLTVVRARGLKPVSFANGIPECRLRTDFV